MTMPWDEMNRIAARQQAEWLAQQQNHYTQQLGGQLNQAQMANAYQPEPSEPKSNPVLLLLEDV